MIARCGKFNHARLAFWRLRPHLGFRKFGFYNAFKTIVAISALSNQTICAML